MPAKSWFLRRMLGLFRVLSRMSGWFETRFTTAGSMVLGGAVVAAIFGIDPRQTLALHMAAILLGIIAVAMFLSLRWRPRLVVRRHLPETVTVDTQATYLISITNQSDTPEHDLVLADRLLTRYPTVVEFRHSRFDAQEQSVNWFDRIVGFPRWLNLLRAGRGARLEAISLPSIPAHTTLKVALRLKPLRRGKLVFTEIDIKRADPFGVFFARNRQNVHDDVIALPKRYPMPQLQWVSERHFHRGGLTLAATVGDSEEFVGLREYRPGDALRHIHWRSFAKRGVPVVKEHEDEFFDRHALVVDTYLGPLAPAYFEAAVSIAASLIHSDRPSDSILDLVFIEQQVWRLTTGRGLSNNGQILAQLAELQPAQTDEFDHVTTYLRRYLDRLASVVIICTTWDPRRQAFLEELQHRRLRCLTFRVGEPPAAAPEGHNHPLTIRPSRIQQDIEAVMAAAG